jgi:hypothetical protein
MTIAAAVKTGSAVVFAADSKVTTRGLAHQLPERRERIRPAA